MKKSLIALAVLAASGAAMAQSSVTLYGIFDIGYSKATGVKFGQNNGGVSFHTPSRWGMRGSEDLGGGLRANFDLQTANNDLEIGSNTASATGFFNREAWVGLSGGWGSTRIGRTSSVATQSMARFDFNEISSSSAINNVKISPVTWYGSSRRSSQFQYATPNMGGLDAGLGFVTSGDNGTGNPCTANCKSYTQARVNYANGPIAAGLVAETKHAVGQRTAWALAGSYDLGMVKLGAGYVVSPTAAIGKGWHLGAISRFGANEVGAQFARNSTTKDKAFELFYKYHLSKRTRLYVDAVRVNYSSVLVPDVTKYGLGILHAF